MGGLGPPIIASTLGSLCEGDSIRLLGTIFTVAFILIKEQVDGPVRIVEKSVDCTRFIVLLFQPHVMGEMEGRTITPRYWKVDFPSSMRLAIVSLLMSLLQKSLCREFHGFILS